MNVLTREHPDATMNRHASALSDIKKMHDDYRAMQTDLADANRLIDQQANKIDLLMIELEKSQQYERVYRRKLIRLASAMDMIGKLSKDAEEIMRSAREFEETDAEAAAETASAAEAVANLPKPAE